MTTIIIPKSILKTSNLIAIPIEKYEELLNFKKKHSELDRDLNASLKEVKESKNVSKSFTNTKDFFKALKI